MGSGQEESSKIDHRFQTIFLSRPTSVYGKERDWKGFADFLGSKPSPKYVEMWPFPKARDYVRSLRLLNSTDIANGRTAGGMTFRKNLRKCPLNHG